MAGLAQSLGRDVGQVLTGGARKVRKWQHAVRQLVAWAVMAAVLVLAFAEIVMLNVHLLPDPLLARVAVLAVLAGVGVFGWKRFKRMGRVASYRFQRAVAAEKRRAQKAKRPVALTVSVPTDFYRRLEISAGSPAVGETIRSLDIRAKTGASVVGVVRAGETFRNPGPTWCFEPGDVVSAIGDPPQLAALHQLLACGANT